MSKQRKALTREQERQLEIWLMMQPFQTQEVEELLFQRYQWKLDDNRRRYAAKTPTRKQSLSPEERREEKRKRQRASYAMHGEKKKARLREKYRAATGSDIAERKARYEGLPKDRKVRHAAYQRQHYAKKANARRALAALENVMIRDVDGAKKAPGEGAFSTVFSEKTTRARNPT